MEIKLAQNKEKWNKWLEVQGAGNFFAQSWEWGEVLAREGKTVERLMAEENGQILAQASVYYMGLPFGWHYAFCPQGPKFDDLQFSAHGSQIMDLFSEYFKEKNCIFFRFESTKKIMAQKTIDINPRATLMLDLTQPEEEILSGMHQKTRYNINLAGKKNLEIKNNKDVKIFYKLMEQTGKRDDFKLHHQEHYQNILATNNTFQLTAYNQNESVASVVLIGFGQTFTYLYGASNYEHRQLMAPYLLQWEGVMLGKKLGYKNYDFFGISPNYDAHHQYAGVTRFKQGFGGKYCETPGTHDLILDKNKYKLYRLLRFVRRLI